MQQDLSVFRKLFSSEKTWHQGVWSLADQGVASVTNFTTGLILARACSKEEFGLYMLGFTVILLVTDLQASLIATPYMVYAPRLRGANLTLYSGSTIIHQLTFSLVSMIVLALGAMIAHLGVGPRGLEPVLWALSAMLSLIMFREFVRRMYFVQLKIRAALLFDLGIGVTQVCGLLLCSQLHLLTPSRAYWLIGTVCGLAVISWLWLDRKSYRLSVRSAVSDMKHNWLFGKWVFASGLLWTASTNLYPWLLAFFHGAAAAGVFAACLGIVSASNPALLGLNNFLGPKIAHKYAIGGPDNLRKFVLKVTAALAVPISVLALALIVWGDRLIALLYGHRYAGNGLVVAVLAVNLLVSALAFSFSRALFAIERADLDFSLNVAAILIMATLGLWLVRSYGPLGACYGLLVANIVASVARAATFLSLQPVIANKEEVLT